MDITSRFPDEQHLIRVEEAEVRHRHLTTIQMPYGNPDRTAACPKHPSIRLVSFLTMLQLHTYTGRCEVLPGIQVSTSC